MRIGQVGEALLVFDRIGGDERLRCWFNLSYGAVPWTGGNGRVLASTGEMTTEMLGCWAAVIEQID
jgi:hypothetical protein